MNWLIYIGGGFTALIFWWYLLMYFLGSAFTGKNYTTLTIPLHHFIPVILVWVWVCIYIIRPYAVMVAFYQALLGI